MSCMCYESPVWQEGEQFSRQNDQCVNSHFYKPVFSATHTQICKEVCKHYRCTIASYWSCPAILAQVLGTHLSQNRARRDELFCSSRFLPPTLPCKMTACSSLCWLLCSALARFAQLGPPASRTSHRRDARWFLLRTAGGTSTPIAIVSRWWDLFCRAELLLKASHLT